MSEMIWRLATDIGWGVALVYVTSQNSFFDHIIVYVSNRLKIKYNIFQMSI